MPRLLSFYDVLPVLQPLQRGELILTSNQRLATRVINAYGLHCAEQGIPVVKSPQVLSLGGWIDRCWQQLLMQANPRAIDNQVLSRDQELLLWQSVVEQSELGMALLRPAATAEQAMSAYRLLADWQLDVHSHELRQQFESDEDAVALLQWVLAFEERCDKKKLLTSQQRIPLIREAFACGDLSCPEIIHTLGFQDIPPLQSSLLNQIGGLREVAVSQESADVSVVECGDPVEELTASAVWAKQVLKNDPSARVAVVIPDLAQRRSQIERVFTDVFRPAENAPSETELLSGKPNRRALPFNMSAGYPLIEAPVIAAALDVLSLFQHQLEIEYFERICLSPFYTDNPGDHTLKPALLNLVRRQRVFQLRTARFRQLADQVATGESGEEWIFAARLQQLGTQARGSLLNKPMSMAQWCEFFQQALQDFGWPGSRSPDSIEYQQLVQWQQVVQQCCTFGAESGCEAIDYPQALSVLRGVLSRQVFQPQTADSSLQLLGQLEAVGLQFTHLWLHSMSDKQWPAAASPHPLLPLSLQRSLQMPHANAERELRYARQLTASYLTSARHLVVSSPGHIDNVSVSVSKLFQHYPTRLLKDLLGRELSSLLPLREIKRRFIEASALEKFEPGDAPPVEDADNVRGGVRIFASQSACPFRAMVQHRLNVQRQDQPEIGLNAAERGNNLHRALELLWKSLGTQSRLLGLSDEESEELCLRVSRYALDQCKAHSPEKLGPRYFELELNRLSRLLVAWLEIEKQRGSFEVVEAEKSLNTSLGGLPFKARIDRIDRLADGSYLIVDYKTGSCSVGDWWGDRPEDPQMPLYSLVTPNDSNVEGIAFAQIKVGDSRYKGVGSGSADESFLGWKDSYTNESGQQNWQGLQAHWRRVLERLAEDFINGRAAVDPKFDPADNARTCQYCHLKSVCRIGHKEQAGL